jgi:hypothetical protein
MSRRHASRVETCAPAAPTEPPLLLTPEQSFRLLQVGRTHGWRLINSGAIPTVKLSPRCIRVPRQALEDLIAAGGVQQQRAAQLGRTPLRLHARRGDPCARKGQPDAQDKRAGSGKPTPVSDADPHPPEQRLMSCPATS